MEAMRGGQNQADSHHHGNGTMIVIVDIVTHLQPPKVRPFNPSPLALEPGPGMKRSVHFIFLNLIHYLFNHTLTTFIFDNMKRFV